MRLDWDSHFMRRAYVVAEMATCPRASVGAVLVRGKHELVSGFNGAAKGLPHCTDVGCEMENGHCVTAVHAEANAIVQAALHGVSTAGATAYVTHTPCRRCTNMLINAGITRIVYGIDYRSEQSLALLKEAGIIYERIAVPATCSAYR